MKVNFIRGSVQGVGSITITLVGDMRVIGLMRSMMGMVWKLGREGADIAGNIGKD